MASLVLLVSEYLHPLSMQLDYNYFASSTAMSTATGVISLLEMVDDKVSKDAESETQLKNREVDLVVEELPHLWLDSELVWP